MLGYFSLLALCAVYTMSQDVEIDAAHSSICHQLPYLQHYCGSQIRDCYDCSKVAQGKPGHPGATGPPGQKGAKGDRGETPDVTDELSDLQYQVNDLKHENQELQSHLDSLKSSLGCSAFQAEPGWFSAGSSGNCFQYQKTDTEQTWEESRKICQARGGDLAHIGIRDLLVRSLLVTNLLGERNQNEDTWIGINDIHHEGKFVFLDGVAVNSHNNEWAPGEPNNAGGNEDCVHLHFIDSHHVHNTANDFPCSHHAYALCEKPLRV